MKNAGSTNNSQSIQGQSNASCPQNKNDPDSREGEEQELKGDDQTHNKKDTKAASSS